MELFICRLTKRKNTIMTELEFKKVNDAAMVLRAMKNPLRQKILSIIDNDPGISVTDIYEKLHIEQSVASQHLAVLRESSIVKTERHGKSIRYYPDEASIKGILVLADQLSVYFKS